MEKGRKIKPGRALRQFGTMLKELIKAMIKEVFSELEERQATQC